MTTNKYYHVILRAEVNLKRMSEFRIFLVEVLVTDVLCYCAAFKPVNAWSGVLVHRSSSYDIVSRLEYIAGLKQSAQRYLIYIFIYLRANVTRLSVLSLNLPHYLWFYLALYRPDHLAESSQ